MDLLLAIFPSIHVFITLAEPKETVSKIVGQGKNMEQGDKNVSTLSSECDIGRFLLFDIA